MKTRFLGDLFRCEMSNQIRSLSVPGLSCDLSERKNALEHLDKLSVK